MENALKIIQDILIRLQHIWMLGKGGGESKKKKPLTRSTWEVIGPNYLSNQTQPNQDNLSIRRIKKIEGGSPLEEVKEQISL